MAEGDKELTSGKSRTIATDAYLVKKTRAHHQDLAKGLAQEIIPNNIDHTPGVGVDTAARAAVDIVYYPANTLDVVGEPTLCIASKSKLEWDAAKDMFNLTGNHGASHLSSELGQGQKIFAMGHGGAVHVETIAVNRATGDGVYLLWRRFPEEGKGTRQQELNADHEALYIRFYVSVEAPAAITWCNLDGTRSPADSVNYNMLVQNTAFKVISAQGVFSPRKTEDRMEQAINDFAVHLADDDRFGKTAVVQFYTKLDEVPLPNGSKDEPYRLATRWNEDKKEDELTGDIIATKSGKSVSYWVGRYWQKFDKLKRHTLRSGERVHWNYDITINGVDMETLVERDRVADEIVNVLIAGARLKVGNPAKTWSDTTDIDGTFQVRIHCALHPRCFEGITATRPYPPEHGPHSTRYVDLDARGALGTGGVCFHINRYLNYGNPNALIDGRLSDDTLGLRDYTCKPQAIYQAKANKMIDIAHELGRLAGCEFVQAGFTQAGLDRFRHCFPGGLPALVTLITGNGDHPNGMAPTGDRRALHKITFADSCYVFNGGNLPPNDNKTGYSCSGDGPNSVRAWCICTLLRHLCRNDPFMVYHLNLINAKPNTALVPHVRGASTGSAQVQPGTSTAVVLSSGPSSGPAQGGAAPRHPLGNPGVEADANRQRREQQRKYRKKRASAASKAVFDFMCRFACQVTDMELDVLREQRFVPGGSVHASLRGLLASGHGFVTIEEPSASAQSFRCRWAEYAAFQVTKALMTHPAPPNGDIFSRLGDLERMRLIMVQAEAIKNGASIKEPETDDEGGEGGEGGGDDSGDSSEDGGPPPAKPKLPPKKRSVPCGSMPSQKPSPPPKKRKVKAVHGAASSSGHIRVEELEVGDETESEEVEEEDDDCEPDDVEDEEDEEVRTVHSNPIQTTHN